MTMGDYLNGHLWDVFWAIVLLMAFYSVFVKQ